MEEITKKIEMNMTRVTANIVLLTMLGVWAYLSISQSKMIEVSYQFILLATIVAGGDLGPQVFEFFRKKP
jgi:ABC-type protease/lipase transport system fused ATPase/permease subunit